MKNSTKIHNAPYTRAIRARRSIRANPTDPSRLASAHASPTDVASATTRSTQPPGKKGFTPRRNPTEVERIASSSQTRRSGERLDSQATRRGWIPTEFGVSLSKRRVVIRRIGRWVIRFRPARCRSIARRAVRPDARPNERTRSVATEPSETKFTRFARTERRPRLAARRSTGRRTHLASATLSRERAFRSNLSFARSERNHSVPFRSHP